MKIVSIVGARPEFIQAMPVSQALRACHQEILVHTGQHYDYRMSQAFFDELPLPRPDYNLGVGSGSHASQTAELLIRLEAVLLKEQPDLVIVRGDTNSTLAGALASSKLHIPSAHIEAGERSFDRFMPEEINRVIADHIADLHFCVGAVAVRQLRDEGIQSGVYLVGDVMLDAFYQVQKIARRSSTILDRLAIRAGQYALVTIHRAENTDAPARLGEIVDALNSAPDRIVFPVHPRTRKALQSIQAVFKPHVQLIEPVGYLDMLALEENACLIATDSGGVQREAYFLSKPCLTVREETEWVETVTSGWNQLVGVKKACILHAWSHFSPPADHPLIFGDGTAAAQIAQILDRGPIHFGKVARPGNGDTAPALPAARERCA